MCPPAGNTWSSSARGGPKTGTYGFSLVRVGPDGAFAIQPNDAIALDRPSSGAGRIEASGSVDHCTFQATPGEQLAVVDMLSSTPSCSDLRWDLLDPSGAALDRDQILCAGAERPPIAATSTGRYTLQGRGAGEAVRTYAMLVRARR
jgi:hypothetical protein